MPTIKPFKALHATEKNISTFPSRPIENYTQEEIQQKLDSIYESIVQIVAPTFQSSQDHRENYRHVRQNFEEFIENDSLKEDPAIAFYVYQQKGENFCQRGIVALFDLREVDDHKIRLHENTLQKRKEMFAEYLEEVHIQSEPVLLTYPTNSKIELFMDKEMKSKPFLNYKDERGTEHTIWKMDNRLNMQNLRETFERMEALYIADGHHRLASTQIYSDSQKGKEKSYIGNEPFHFVLGYAVGHEQLEINEYNRLIKDLNGLSKEEFFSKLEGNFKIVPKGDVPYYPSHKHHISMYIDGEFYGLYIDHSLRGKPKGLGELDTYLFEELVSKPILGIQDSTLDDRVDFIKGTGNPECILALKDAVDSDKYKVGFGFHPIPFQDLKLISDLNLKMPPKSTYICPKLLTGLLMYNMKKV